MTYGADSEMDMTFCWKFQEKISRVGRLISHLGKIIWLVLFQVFDDACLQLLFVLQRL